ncbi:desmoplakin [Epinotia aporema granulovirus]|uniref:Desmoplakin n=1 Tax=Epinotia aporema granulovirus TaxID=166056 RepID=K4EQF4_9BBAC|nr:desmoplakin [Epinotia aporema granulovirus]AER41533.1 desmoplakin [Epinotia aporema granulovirus]
MNNPSLTRYKGVDVTPKTFENLIKTVAQYGTAVGSSKTEYDRRIRGIILNFCPNLIGSSANMSTEHLLMRVLSRHMHTKNVVDNSDDDDDDDENDNYMHKYLRIMSNKNEWSEKSLWKLLRMIKGSSNSVNQLKELYHKKFDGNLLDALKLSLGVKKLSQESCVKLVTSFKNYFWCPNVDCVDNYYELINQAKKYHEEYNSKEEQIVQMNKKLNDYMEDTERLNEQIATLTENNLVLRNKITALNENIEDQNYTINMNVMEMAKMASRCGDLECDLEKVTNNYNAEHNQLIEKYNHIDQENNTLLTTVERLKIQLQQTAQELDVVNENLTQCRSQCLKLATDHDNDNKDQTQLIKSIKELTDNKHYLEEQLHEAQRFRRELESRQNSNLVIVQQMEDKFSRLQQQLERKNEELLLIKARQQDEAMCHQDEIAQINKNAEKRIASLESKLQSAQDDLTKQYNDDLLVIEEKDIQNKKLLQEHQEVRKRELDHMRTIAELEEKLSETYKDNQDNIDRIKKLQGSIDNQPNIDSLNEQIKKLQGVIDNQQGIIDNQQGIINNQPNVDSLNDQIKNLQGIIDNQPNVDHLNNQIDKLQDIITKYMDRPDPVVPDDSEVTRKRKRAFLPVKPLKVVTDEPKVSHKVKTKIIKDSFIPKIKPYTKTSDTVTK